MDQTILSKKEGSLISYAISKLNPDVFSHPVWVRFGKQTLANPLPLLHSLLNVAEKLEKADPDGSCQVLLICAVFQCQSGQYYNAVRTIHKVLALAEHTGLARASIWALWGACSISYLKEDYEQTERHLVDLQTALSQQNEWILGDFVDVIRQAVQHPEMAQPGMQHDPIEDLVTFTFYWLKHWGFPNEISAYDSELAGRGTKSHSIKWLTSLQSFFSIQYWQGHWHSLLLAIRGELHFRWTQNAVPQQKSPLHSSWSLVDTNDAVNREPTCDSCINDEVPQTLLESPSQFGGVEAYPRSKVRKQNTGSAIQRQRPNPTTIPMAVHMLGPFGFAIGDLVVKLPASRGLSVLKYLLFHHKQYISREVLMDVFWPDTEPKTARNNLNVAMYNLRKALRNVIFLPVIAFEDGAYRIQTELQIWLDVDEFEKCVKTGRRLETHDQTKAAVAEFETAVSLYQGDFLEENPYEEWTILDRERLRVDYLDTVDRLGQMYFRQGRYAACIASCQLILARDRCREDAHCLLMRCYSRQEQHHLALRQYQLCAEALRVELGVKPAPETMQLYECIRRRELV